MKKHLTNLHKEVSHLRLSAEEKSAMREAIFGAAPSPVVASPYVFGIFSYTRYAFASIVALLLVGGGTISAAASALPGDILYGVKLTVMEPVELALAPTEIEKADVELRLAERRIEEAQSLAVAGVLTEETAIALAERFEKHAQNADTLAVTIEEKQPGSAADIKASLASSISVQGALLKHLGRRSVDEKTKKESEVLATRVLARVEDHSMRSAAKAVATLSVDASSNTEGVATMMAMSAPAPEADVVVATDPAATRMAEDTSGQERSARIIMTQSRKVFDDVEKLWKEVSTLLDEESRVTLEASLKEARAYDAAGEAALESKDFMLARDQFSALLTSAVKIRAMLNIEKRLDNGILSDFLKTEERGE